MVRLGKGDLIDERRLAGLQERSARHTQSASSAGIGGRSSREP